LNNLLDLKQKQANAWEARFSREETVQTQRQGNVSEARASGHSEPPPPR
jgi:hypothetical protein